MHTHDLLDAVPNHRSEATRQCRQQAARTVRSEMDGQRAVQGQESLTRHRGAGQPVAAGDGVAAAVGHWVGKTTVLE